jgi:gliding motility-associated lipoprotein GldH
MWAMLQRCDRIESVAYSNYKGVRTAGWLSEDALLFDPFAVADSSNFSADELYDVVISVRHNDSYPYDTLWLSLEQPLLEQNRFICDTVPVAFTNALGMWRGEGQRNIFIVADTIARGVHINPGWQLAISHAMTNDTIPGINDIGVIILKHK